MSDCLFCKIVNGDIPSKKVYESDEVLAFEDINPQAPTHILVIPKKHIPTLNHLEEVDKPLVGQIFLAAKQIAREREVDQVGYRTVFNVNSAAGQEVFHVHLHLLGGRMLKWPPG